MSYAVDPGYSKITIKASDGTEKKEDFTESTKAEATRKWLNKCMKCHKELGPGDVRFDYRNDDVSDNSLENCGIHCVSCYSEVSTIRRRTKQQTRSAENSGIPAWKVMLVGLGGILLLIVLIGLFIL